MVVVLCFVADLDVQTMLEEARSRWLRPNEIHAVLSNPKYFTINVKPVNLPTSNISYTPYLYSIYHDLLVLITQPHVMFL